MLLKRVSHSRALPTGISTNQMLSVSKNIHGHISEAIEPLLESRPEYHALNKVLGTVGQAINQLEAVQSRRKTKGVNDARGVGGLDGEVGSEQITLRKREIYLVRKGHLRRLRQAIEWQMLDVDKPDRDLTPEGAVATRLLNKFMSKRHDRFESLSYEESHSECDLFISAVEADPSASGGIAALATLGLSGLYQRMKSSHAVLVDIHNEQTQLDAEREELPKFPAARRELRRTIRVLLTFLHFDVENGDDTLLATLAHCDEIIDKARAVGKRRETIAEQKAQQGQNGNTSGGNTTGNTDPTDAPNEKDETDESNAPDASDAPDASTSAPSPQADNVAATETEVAQG